MVAVRTPLETVFLEDPRAQTRVWLSPERGGIATRFFQGERPVLYLDEATLLDPTKNIRGGAPVLFPSPGPLTNGTFTWQGASGRLPQHGFARQKPWSVLAHDGASVTMELRSDDATRDAYPWDFVVTFRYALVGTELRIEQRYAHTGTSPTPMPFATGFHPYFHVAQSEKSKTHIVTNATRAYDNFAKREITLTGPIDLTATEVDLHLIDHGSNEAVLLRADGTRIRVSGSPEFSRWVVWTLEGKDFVCLEPWTAAADALNTGRDLLLLAPNETRELVTTIRVES